MQWLVVLDSVEGLKPKTDTSLALINQGRKSGLRVDTATIDKLFFSKQASVIAEDMSGAEHRRNLCDYDLILMRKEPPYDLAFHYATHLLSLSGTLVVNAPSALRDFNEKLITLPFHTYMPATLVSSSVDQIAQFFSDHDGGVIKALDSFQGKSVQRLTASDRELIEQFTAGGTQPVMAQEFLDAVYDGDKRVLMLGKDFLGASLRRPREGYHANFAMSDALATTLTSREQQIVEELGPWMVKRGIHFAGLDFIGETLTEINITCPTGIMQISELDGRDLAQEMADYFVTLCGEDHQVDV
jgi:glutathione synthase